MAEKKWSPSAKLALAIAKLEEQQGGSLVEYGTAEHLAVIRYLIAEHCKKNAAGESILDMAGLKADFATESAYLGYASNAKKQLQAAKFLPENGASGRGYE